MSPEHAFLRAIKEKPHDDTLRLVFTDWLEENGQPERAEFVRLQVERGDVPEYAPGWKEPGSHEQQLMAEHGGQWLGFWGRLEPDTWQFRKFRRGLLQVQCHAKWLSELLGEHGGEEALGWVERMNLGG